MNVESRIFRKATFIAIITILCFFSACLVPRHRDEMASDKMTFWDTSPQCGANGMNKIPTREWFQEAAAIRIRWIRLVYDKWDTESRDFLVGDASEKSSGLGIKAAGGLQLTVVELPMWIGRLCDEEKCKVGIFIFSHRSPHSGHDAKGIESRSIEQDAGRINASRIISALLARYPEKEGVSA